jgi:hypothetical protein
MRWPILLLALSLPAWAAPSKKPPTDVPIKPHVSARSRIFLRLDPSAVPDPNGDLRTAALGSFRLYARDGAEAEASGWIGHAPGAASYADDALSGDLTTLLFRRRFGDLQLTVGRQWTRIGSSRLEALDGATAHLTVLNGHLELDGRVGMGGLEPRDAFGNVPEAATQVRLHALDGAIFELGVRHQQTPDTVPRTRWNLGAEWWGTPDLSVAGFATTDVRAKAVVEARLELKARPSDTIWLRGYGRHSRVDLLLAADEVLAVFAEDVRDEAGSVAEWQLLSGLRLRLDAAAIYSRDRVGAGRYRLAADLKPKTGATAVVEGTLRIDRSGRSGTTRVATRWPLWQTIFVTGEALADLDPREDLAGFGRLGLGFQPLDGWFTYGALEGARAQRWPDGRLAGLLLVEHAIGAPVRWGSGP